jgi:predicted nucleic acid-binding protein
MLEDREGAIAWVAAAGRQELELCWPSLLYVEVANTLLVLERAAGLEHERSRSVLRAIAAIDARSFGLEGLSGPAWVLGRERGLSAYDACYVVLAETLAAPLVTADRRLAAATENGVLIADSAP